MSLTISTDRLISSSEARKVFGKLLKDIAKNAGNYFAILENGKLAAILVHPNWLKDEANDSFPNLEQLRQDWTRHAADITKAMEKIMELDQAQLPKLLK